METLDKLDAEFDDHDDVVSGPNSDVDPANESELLRSDGEGSIVEPNQRLKRKRIGKRNRQRLQKRLSGLALAPITEETSNGSTSTPKRTRTASGSTPEMRAKKSRTYSRICCQHDDKKIMRA